MTLLKRKNYFVGEHVSGYHADNTRKEQHEEVWGLTELYLDWSDVYTSLYIIRICIYNYFANSFSNYQIV